MARLLTMTAATTTKGTSGPTNRSERTLGDKLQLLVKLQPDALDAIEHYVDWLIGSGAYGGHADRN